MSIVRNLLIAAFVGAVATSAALPALATPAQTVQPGNRAGLVECQFSGPATFKPGIRVAAFKLTLTLKSNNRQCIDDAGDVKTATFSGTVQGPMSCLGSPGSNEGKGKITWKLEDGTTDTSVVDFHLTGTSLAEGSVEGAVVSGRYEGEEFRGDVAVDIIEGAVKCATISGATEATFNGTFSVG